MLGLALAKDTFLKGARIGPATTPRVLVRTEKRGEKEKEGKEAVCAE